MKADLTQDTDDATRVSGRQVLALARPALGALLAEPLFVLADSAIVGHLGPARLAGLGTAGAALNTLVNVCIFLTYSTTAQVSRLIGAGRRKQGLARGIDGLYLAAGLGLLLAVVGVLGADPIVHWLGARTLAAPYAATYLRVSSVPQFVPVFRQGKDALTAVGGMRPTSSPSTGEASATSPPRTTDLPLGPGPLHRGSGFWAIRCSPMRAADRTTPNP